MSNAAAAPGLSEHWQEALQEQFFPLIPEEKQKLPAKSLINTWIMRNLSVEAFQQHRAVNSHLPVLGPASAGCSQLHKPQQLLLLKHHRNRHIGIPSQGSPTSPAGSASKTQTGRGRPGQRAPTVLATWRQRHRPGRKKHSVVCLGTGSKSLCAA